MRVLHGPPDPIDWLQSEYEIRRLKNPRYSLRAYARLLGVQSGRLCEFLGGKRILTPKTGEKIAARLGLSAREREQFVASIVSFRKLAFNKDQGDFVQLSEDTFSQISDWYYLTLLNALTIEGASHEPKALAKRLGLKTTTVKRALAALERLGLIARRGQRLVRTTKPITTSKDVPSHAIQNFQRQMLDKAQEALISVPATERDFSTSMFVLAASDLEKVKDLIQSSRRSIASHESRKGTKRLYALSIQLFPLSEEDQP